MKIGKANTFIFSLIMLAIMLCWVGPAQAYVVEFNTITAPIIEISDTHQTLGKVSIDFPDVRALPTNGVDEEGAWLTVSLPSGCKFAGTIGQDASAAGLAITSTGNIVIGTSLKTAANTVEFEVFGYPDNADDYDGSILLSFNSVLVSTGSGDVIAQFLSNSSVFGPLHSATIARIGKDGRTTCAAKSVKRFVDAGGELDTILVLEAVSGVFEPDETIQLSLPAGFAWNDSNVNSVQGAWGLTGQTYNWAIDPDNPRILEVYINDKVTTNSAGRINIGSDAGGYFAIDVQDNAEYGDIYITVSSDKGAINTTDILAAVYLGLESIAITNPADKLIYNVGDPLDISGLVVTGTYSDGSTQVENITAANITGFDSSVINPALPLTVTVGDQTATYTVEIQAAAIDECFIATAAFGSKFTWPVALLRHFRDQYLLSNSLGTAFVRCYYQHSPPIAEMIAGSKPLKMLVRLLLAPVIAIVYMLYHPMLIAATLMMIFLLYGYRLRRKWVQA